jgi:hypothetical protein
MKSPTTILAALMMLYITLASPVDIISVPSQPVVDKRSTSSWAPLGCWSDDRNHRTLGTYNATLEDVTVDTCEFACYNSGFILAGVEYGDECWCDHEVQAGTIKVDGSYCNFHCSGDAQETCGGDLVIDIYSYNPTTSTTVVAVTTASTSNTPTLSAITMPGTYISLGCYTDSTSDRTLDTVGDFPGAEGGMTITPCQGACQNAGYVFAGVEFGHECWCGSLIGGAGTLSPDNECNMPCSGNAAEMCGGSNRINIYAFIAIPASMSITASPSSSMPTSTSPASLSSTSICTIYYQVVSGEYCYDIWTRFRISQEQFASWNPSLVWPDPLIVPGQTLCVQQGPAGSPVMTVTGLPATPTPT